ncbi:unnamed protein product [Cochlearia groenlandica]
MQGNKKNNGSIRISDSQEIFLRSCGYARRGSLPDPDPTVGISPPLNRDGETESRRVSVDSETESVICSRYGEDLVEIRPIRFVSPPQSADTVDLEEDSTDLTVPVESKDSSDRTAPVESKVDEEEERKKKKRLKVPIRDVVKAIVMNSRNVDEEEEDKDNEKISFVQILINKGFKFP